MRTLKKLFSTLLMVVFLQKNFAQSFTFRQYNEDNGFNQTYIYAMSQSAKGFLFLSTGEGIYRFDGHNFLNLADSKVAANFVSTHFIDSRDVVWVGHNQNGISYLKDNTFYALNNPEIGQAKVTAFVEDPRKNIWVITNGAGLFFVDTGFKLTAFPDNDLLYGTSLCRGHGNDILVGTSTGLYVVRPGDNPKSRGKKNSLLNNAGIKQILRGKAENEFWVLSEEGVFLLRHSNGEYKISLHLKEELHTEQPVTSIYLDNSGNLWVAIQDEGLQKFTFRNNEQSGRFIVSKINARNGLKVHNIQSIYEDTEGNLWLGTFGEGLVQKPVEKFFFYNEKHGLKNQDIKKIVGDSSGNLWIACESGVACYNPKSSYYKLYSGKDGFVPGAASTLLYDTGGDLWVGTTSGIYQMNISKGRFRNQSKLFGLNNISVNCLVQNHDQIIAGTVEGIYIYNKKSGATERLTTNEGLLHNNVLNLFLDSRDRLWVCSHGTPPYYIHKGKVFPFKEMSGSNSFKINAVAEDHQGNIWIATDGDGVFKYDNRLFQAYDESRGLLSNYCNGLAVGAMNSVWVTHRNGLSEKKARQGLFTSYSEKSGLLYYDNNRNSLYNDGVNSLWFGTNSGIVQYRFEAVNVKEHPPEILVNRISFNNEELPVTGKIEKKPGYYSIHIGFMAVSLGNPDNILYRYRLLEVDSVWRTTTMASVDFPKLGDGNYTFQVMACNIKNGLCSTTPSSIEFIIKKPVWKRIWFYVLLVSVIVLITYLIVDQRTKRLIAMQQLLQLKVKQKTFLLQREKEAVEKIKGELENRNKDITDSINYAKNIQESILPPEETMMELFGKNHFVLFRPKDIVSGDFYWTAALNVNNNNKKNLSLAAVIDCTGHGVPGAFLSIMANDFLKQSIIDRRVNNTNEILNFLNAEVSSHLNQSLSKERLKDGMDIALIGIDYGEKKLYYAGANNPAYIIRGTGKETETFILKATKQAIGLVTENAKPYEMQIFDLLEGDTIYLFSDGFADQFGGKKNKKLTYKRFRDLLHEAYTMPIPEQKTFLESSFDEWKGENPQTDDVCVLGIKI